MVSTGSITGYLVESKTLKFLKYRMTTSLAKYKKGGHPMIYQDKSLQCYDCSTTFIFGTEEQEQFASRGHTNVPKRCPSCREVRKARQLANGGNGHNSRDIYSSGSYSDRSFSSAPRQMFPVICATCGEDTQVPFEPRGDRPVYCPNCYRKTNPVKRY